MDALRKAEQEKREAAKRLEQAGDAPAVMPASTEITDHGSAAAVAAAPEPALASPSAGGLSLAPDNVPPAAAALESADAPTPPAVPPGLSLETTGDRLSLQPVAAAPPVAAPSPAPVAAAPSADHDVTHKMAMELDLDTTFQGIDIGKAAAAVPGMYDETIADDFPGAGAPARGLEDTLPGVSAVQLVRDIGGGHDQPTPVAAETIFHAGQNKTPGSPLYRWSLGAAAVLAVLAAFVWQYFTVTPINRAVPSPWVARGIETTVAAVGPPAGAPAIPTDVPAVGPEAAMIGAGTPGTVLPPASTAAVPQTVPAGAPLPAPAAAETPVAPAATATAPAGTVAAPADQSGTGSVAVASPPAATPEQPEAAAAEQTLPVYLEPPPAIIINRAGSARARPRLLDQAFDAYRAGDYATAKTHYQAVLADTPASVDALAGLGAIALREGDQRGAAEYYARVLLIDPRHQNAAAVLLGMQKGRDPVQRESAVKTILQEFPEHAFLHYTLGNLYASQQRWADAQQAFFDAHRFDSSNPDYAMNLAVSLDRLGQAQTALDYYQTALKLSEEQRAGFDPSAVLARIQAIESTATP
jgi:TolA-binding protein